MPDIKLTELQKDVLAFFGRHSFGSSFYWTGGTLLAYCYLHHRLSVDLDFFSEDLFNDDQYLSFINDLKKEIGAEKVTLNAQYNRRLYLIERNNEPLKIELVFFPFPRIEKEKDLSEFSVKIDSLTDIMVNKTLSTYQRQEPKDVYDLYCYLNNQPKYNLDTLVSLVEKKFGVSIEPTLLIAKINELADNLESLTPLLVKPVKNLSAQTKDFFQEIFNSLVKDKINP